MSSQRVQDIIRLNIPIEPRCERLYLEIRRYERDLKEKGELGDRLESLADMKKRLNENEYVDNIRIIHRIIRERKVTITDLQLGRT